MQMRPLDPKSGFPIPNYVTAHAQSVHYSPNPQQVGAVPLQGTGHIPDEFTYPSIDISSCATFQATLNARPDPEGWVRDTVGGLLYWVPPDRRMGLNSPVLLTIPQHSPLRAFSLNFDHFAFGVSWTRIFNSVHL
jgi:hypothetical protein